MNRFEFDVGENASIEFNMDGDQIIVTHYSPYSDNSIHLKPVHVRALIKFMAMCLPQIEKSERVGQDCDFNNSNYDAQTLATLGLNKKN